MPGSERKRASQETSSYSNLYGVVSRSAIDRTTFVGKILTEFAARDKSPGLFPGKVPFRVNMRGLVAGDCPVMCNCVRLADRELKYARFWDADGNRKRTFRVLGKYYLLDFYTTHL